MARPDVGLRSPHSIRIVVDFPAPFGPRNPKISPLRVARLRWFTATKSPKRFTRSSIATELPLCTMQLPVSRRDRIHKQVLNGRRDLVDGLEGNTRLLQSRLKFRNAAACIVHHHVES